MDKTTPSQVLKMFTVHQHFIFTLIGYSLFFLLSYILLFKNNTIIFHYEQFIHLNAISQLKDSGNSILLLETIFPLNYIVAQSQQRYFLFRIVPFILGIINSTLFYFVIKKVFKSTTQIKIILFTLMFSPFYLYYHLLYSQTMIFFSFLLISILALINQKFGIGLFFLIGCLFVYPALWIIVLFTLIVFFEEYKSRYFLFTLITIFITLYFFILTQSNSFIDLILNLPTFFSDFSTTSGISLFMSIPALIALIYSWKEKEKNRMLYLMLLCLFISSLYLREILFFLDLIIIVLAGTGITLIYNSKWESDLLKNYVLLLIICGLLFSHGSHIKNMNTYTPQSNELLSLEWLSSQENGDVFTYYIYGDMVEYYNLTPYTNHAYFTFSQEKERIHLSNEIFYSRKFESTINFFEKENLKYIWINEQMKNGVIWEKEDDGLLFVIENSKQFEKVYDYQDVQIWRFNATAFP